MNTKSPNEKSKSESSPAAEKPSTNNTAEQPADLYLCTVCRIKPTPQELEQELVDPTRIGEIEEIGKLLASLMEECYRGSLLSNNEQNNPQNKKNSTSNP